MEIRLRGKNIHIDPVIKEYIEEKVSRLDRFLEGQIKAAEVELHVEKNPSIAEGQTIEVTLFTKGPLIRAKDTSSDMHASVDGVAHKLERQIKKYKDKRYKSSTARKNHHSRPPEPRHETEEEEGIVRVKKMDFKPMTPEEAALQMDLLGHSFFVFTNSDSEAINVVYKRRDQNYGLIEPA